MSRRGSILLLALALVAATPALAQKVTIDYDRDFHEKIHTFAWYENDKETSLAKVDPLMYSRIENAIQHYLTAAGLQEVDPDQNPDVYVTYHTNSKQEVQYNTTSFGYGYPGGWYSPYGMGWGGGISSSTTTATTYQRGTLIIDVWYAKTKTLIWRGTASAIVPEKPEKAASLIDRSLQKMVTKWAKMRKQAKKQTQKQAQQNDKS